MDQLLIRPTAAAQTLALSRTAVYQLLDSGELESIRIGTARLIPAEALRAFVEQRRAGQARSQQPSPD